MTGCLRSPGVSSLLIRSPTRVTPSWSTGGSSFYSELVFLNTWFLFVACLCACFFFCLSPSIIKIVNCNLFTQEVLRSSYELVWTCPCVPDRIRILKCWFLRWGENRGTRRKASRSKGENQQQTQPRPRWWEASALTTATPFLPVTLHLSGREFKVPHRTFVLQTADDGLLSFLRLVV